MTWTQHDPNQLEHAKASATKRRRTMRGKGRMPEEGEIKRRRAMAPKRKVRVPGRQDDLGERTVPELRDMAAEHQIVGRGRMNKPQLLRAIRARR